MFALLLSVLLSLFLFAGFGFFVSAILKPDTSFAVKMLMGLVTVNTLTSIISLGLPVNVYVLVALLVLVVAMLSFIKNDISKSISNISNNQTQFIVILLFVTPGILIALNVPDNYDTGLYHTQAIKWIEEYPVVPGLANLHGRFGFNPNVFCLSALTSLYGVLGQHIYSVNLTVFIIIVPWFVNSIYSLFNKQGISGLLLFYVVLFITLLLEPSNLTSPSPDFLSLALTLFIFANVGRIVAENTPLTVANYFPLLILSVYLITVKLSVVPVLLLPLLLLFKCKLKPGQVLLLLGVSGVIVLPWLARNVILSGWLVYPFASVDIFNVDWKVPIAKVAAEHESVIGWARNPGPQYASAAHVGIAGWFPLWWPHFTLYEKLFIASGLLFPLITLCLQVVVKKARAGYLINSIIITALAGGLFWLLNAPVFRFGVAFIVVGVLSPLLIACFSVKQTFKPVLIFNLLIVVLFCAEIRAGRLYIKNSVFNFAHRLIRPQHLVSSPKIIFKKHHINSLDVYEPLSGDRCLGHRLPCTPYPDTLMVLRGKTMNSGFKIKVRQP